MLYLETKWCLNIQKEMFGAKSFISSSTIILKDKKIYDLYVKTVKIVMQEGSIFQKEQMLIELMQMIFEKIISLEAIGQDNVSFDILGKKIPQKSFKENISLNEVAKTIDINPCIFIRNFKKFTGIMPHQYRINIRIEHAKRLLQKGISINGVALECDFLIKAIFKNSLKLLFLLHQKSIKKTFNYQFFTIQYL